MATTRLTGTEAISHAEEHDLTLSSYNDPVEDGREGLTVSEAREIESEGGEVYLDIPDSATEALTDLTRLYLPRFAGCALILRSDIPTPVVEVLVDRELITDTFADGYLSATTRAAGYIADPSTFET